MTAAASSSKLTCTSCGEALVAVERLSAAAVRCPACGSAVQPAGQMEQVVDRPTGRPVVVAITGSSGAPYAVRLLGLLARTGRPIHLLVSPAGAEVLRLETGIEVDIDRVDAARLGERLLAAGRPTVFGGPPAGPADDQTMAAAPTWLHYHHYLDWSAGVASGSFLTAGMVICPCSMGTLAAVANGLSTNLIHRAADVHLKERRRLILVPRETPLNLTHLENMARCVRAGAVVLPAMPGWYHRPKTVEELVEFVVARIVDQLGFEHLVTGRWGQG